LYITSNNNRIPLQTPIIYAYQLPVVNTLSSFHLCNAPKAYLQQIYNALALKSGTWSSKDSCAHSSTRLPMHTLLLDTYLRTSSHRLSPNLTFIPGWTRRLLSAHAYLCVMLRLQQIVVSILAFRTMFAVRQVEQSARRRFICKQRCQIKFDGFVQNHCRYPIRTLRKRLFLCIRQHSCQLQ
jgi:hypothetical protein